MDVSLDVICNLPDIQGYTTIWVELDLFTKRANFILCRILPSVLSRSHFLYRSLDSHMIWIVVLNEFWTTLFYLTFISICHPLIIQNQMERQRLLLNHFIQIVFALLYLSLKEHTCAAKFSYNNLRYSSITIFPLSNYLQLPSMPSALQRF